jgi:BlaI family penicillinase repressor
MPPLQNVTLTDRETDLMEVLWEHGASTVAEVRERLEDDLAYTTVLTILRTLETKGYVRHEADGRAHRYGPIVERDAARRSALRHLSSKFFKGSLELLLTHAVADQKLSATQLQRIRELLEQRSKKGRP